MKEESQISRHFRVGSAAQADPQRLPEIHLSHHDFRAREFQINGRLGWQYLPGQ
jgi:hypothetical protein